MTDAPIATRVAIYAPPTCWPAAFREARRTGGRVVRLFAADDRTAALKPQLDRAIKAQKAERIDTLLIWLAP